MIEYANEQVMNLLKQYDMLSRSLNFITDLKQKKDICDQMTKIIQSVLEQTNTIYENKYKKISERSVFLMDEEKNRLLELINLINERKAYVNNQITNNQETTGIELYYDNILGEDNLEEYKQQVKIIDKYKNNIRMEGILKDELINLEANIKKANAKINNNQNLNKQLEDKMIKVIDNALTKLSLYELQDREKEIDLAYTELGYSLEKAKENAKKARREYSEEIIIECDNMLASITLEYERYKEKKLILKLIYLYRQPVDNYEELLAKREEINNILLNITSSELYSIIGSELNKEYATIKLEGQDIATLKSLTQEKETKTSLLEEIDIENNSDDFKVLLSSLLENEKKYQEKLKQEQQRKEQERLELKRKEEKRKLEEIAKRQKALEEERKKEIERRTKQLLEEKQKPVLMSSKKEETSKDNYKVNSSSKVKQNSPVFPNDEKYRANKTPQTRTEKREMIFKETIPKRKANVKETDDFFSRELNNKIIDKGIPVIKNNNLENKVKTAETFKEPNQTKVFPDIPLDRKENIFPDFPEINKSNSFFDEEEFSELSNYMEDSDKKSWF